VARDRQLESSLAELEGSHPCRRDEACRQTCCSGDKERIKSILAEAELKVQVPDHCGRNCCWKYSSTNQFLGEHSRSRGRKCGS